MAVRLVKITKSDGTKDYSDVILNSTFNKQSLRQNIVRQETLANFLKACKRIFDITGKPVYVLNPTKCQIRKLLKANTINTAQTPLNTSPFYDTKVVKNKLDILKTAQWDYNWTNTDPVFAQQTKQWYPNIDPHKTKELLKLSKTGLGLCIQFITGHNWLLRHKRYYLNNPNMDQTCRLCNENDSREDAFHFWTNCKAMKINKNRVRAILKRDNDTDLVCFSHPLKWSPKQMDRFLTEPSIVQLLSDPGEE